MPFLRRYTIILPLTAVLSFSLVSCQSKVSQCNKLIQVANQAVSQAKTATNGGTTSNPDAMLKAANTMDKAAKDMQGINVSDRELKNYQAGFIKMYQQTSKATRDFVSAFKKKDRTVAETALKNLQQATVPEQQLVTGLNSYCKPK